MTTYSGIDIPTTISVKGPDGRSLADMNVTVTVYDYGSDGYRIGPIYTHNGHSYSPGDTLFPILKALLNISHIESKLQCVMEDA